MILIYMDPMHIFIMQPLSMFHLLFKRNQASYGLNLRLNCGHRPFLAAVLFSLGLIAWLYFLKSLITRYTYRSVFNSNCYG